MIQLFLKSLTSKIILQVKPQGMREKNIREVMKFTNHQKMELNLKKCKEMLIDLRRNKTAIPITNIENSTIERVTSYKLLGLWTDDNMKWNTNTEKIVKKAAKRLFLLKVLKSHGASTSDMKNVYIAVIRPTLEYGAQV